MLSDGQKRPNKTGPKELVFITTSCEETKRVGQTLSQKLPAWATVCFFGDLGVGKTTLLKGLISHRTGLASQVIQSPTFSYLHSYPIAENQLHHFDLYRMKSAKEFLEKGFDEHLFENSLCCLEWPEKVLTLLPKRRYHITLCYLLGEKRKITMTCQGDL